MVDYVVTQNFGNANSIVVRMNNLMGYPNPPTLTERYTVPIEHASDPGTFLVIIKEVWAPALSRNATVADITGELNPAERNTIQSKETLEAQGAFPPDSDLLLLESGDDNLLLEDGTELLLESNIV